MAYIEIHPKSPEAQQRLTDECASVMDLLHLATKSVLNVPDHDIIIELNQCTAIAFNPVAMQAAAVPDVVVKISTSDHDLRPDFQNLCDQVVSSWDAQFGNKLKLELWISSIDAWGSNMGFN